MGAELVALGRVKGTLQEGAEDGGLDKAPLQAGGLAQEGELCTVKREHGGVGKEAAVEVEQLLAEHERVAAAVHLLEETFEQGHGGARVAFDGVEEVLETFFREQAHILGEHAEEAAHQKSGNDGGRVFLFEEARQFGEMLGYLTGDLGGLLGGVERMGVEPDGAQAGAQLGVVQIAQADAVRAGVGKMQVRFAPLGEVREELEAVAHVEGDEEGRRLLVGGQAFDVLLRLGASLDHLSVPGLGAAHDAGVARGGGVDGERGLLRGGVGVLLGLKHEAVAAVEIDAAGGDLAVGAVETHGTLEDVGVAG